MIFYVKLNEENRVCDIITYNLENYKKVDLDIPLPQGILSNIYELKDDKLIYREDWDKEIK